jgi:hypothetical protein
MSDKSEKREKSQSSIDPGELRERLRSMRGRFAEFRGRL